MGYKMKTSANDQIYLITLTIVTAVIALTLAELIPLYAQGKNDHWKMWKDLKDSVEKLTTKFELQPAELAIIIDPSKQKLYVIRGDSIIKLYPISTSKNGIGAEYGSNKTPPGTHRIQSKFGRGSKAGTIFKVRSNTGRIAKIYSDKTELPEDVITTRVMWLEGMEPGVNKDGQLDSFKRTIYIHGTPEEGLIGEPASHGCIRMKNRDVIELFEVVPKNTLVEIQNKKFDRHQKNN